eukprot:CAMPEP_0119005910 /NCGR_PEP_ID=MMETSP1176-20130426/2002_1 /TAXON_ID=265551 /ORGANISM="Synedropsis recta cf, Strain CCMP1620" /LENGTH=214 /DNA_ID=CAMNT_0006957769 /DNA_START=8 /DNA_END=649 /DNA_ORIENTATION=-
MADPLEQRTSGRRAQGRQRQEESAVIVAQSEKRGPSDEMEKRIQQAIDVRKEQLEQTAKLSYEPELVIDGKYEYLDHTADIQLHSWGDTLEEALEQLVVAMFGYKTQINLVKINDEDSAKHASHIKAEGHDLCSLIFAYLQEWLYLFHDSGFLVKEVKIEHLDHTAFTIQSSGRGELADWSRHVQGTEVKAITYSNLQVAEDENGQHHVWAIVD